MDTVDRMMATPVEGKAPARLFDWKQLHSVVFIEVTAEQRICDVFTPPGGSWHSRLLEICGKASRPQSDQQTHDPVA